MGANKHRMMVHKITPNISSENITPSPMSLRTRTRNLLRRAILLLALAVLAALTADGGHIGGDS